MPPVQLETIPTKRAADGCQHFPPVLDQQVRTPSLEEQRQVKSLKNKDGVATKDEDEIGEVWTQHLVNVLGGHKATSVTRCHAKPKRTVEEYSFWPILLEVQNALGKVNARKALGPDGVGADVWRAGGETLARHILRLLQEVIVSEEIPTGMKGSRAVDLYKGKGPADGVDSYRVLSMQDHLSKVFIGMLKAQVLDSLEKDNPSDQYGGVAGGSTDVPTHVLPAFAQRATADGRSHSIIFPDLEKALDMVPRQFFMGARVDEEEVTGAMLVEMGMPERVAEWTCEFLRERGSVLEQWSVDGKVAKLISAIHTHSWMQHEVRKRDGRDHTWWPAELQNRRRHYRSGVRSSVEGLETRLEAFEPHAERTNCAGTTFLAACNSVRRRAQLGERRRRDPGRDVRRDLRRCRRPTQLLVETDDIALLLRW